MLSESWILPPTLDFVVRWPRNGTGARFWTKKKKMPFAPPPAGLFEPVCVWPHSVPLGRPPVLPFDTINDAIPLKVNGLEHPDTLFTAMCLGTAFGAQRKHKEAAKLFRETLVLQEKVYGVRV
jgi:hypothetical protein